MIVDKGVPSNNPRLGTRRRNHPDRYYNNSNNNEYSNYNPSARLVGWIGFHTPDGSEAYLDHGNNMLTDLTISKLENYHPDTNHFRHNEGNRYSGMSRVDDDTPFVLSRGMSGNKQYHYEGQRQRVVTDIIPNSKYHRDQSLHRHRRTSLAQLTGHQPPPPHHLRQGRYNNLSLQLPCDLSPRASVYHSEQQPNISVYSSESLPLSARSNQPNLGCRSRPHGRRGRSQSASPRGYRDGKGEDYRYNEAVDRRSYRCDDPMMAYDYRYNNNDNPSHPQQYSPRYAGQQPSGKVAGGHNYMNYHADSGCETSNPRSANRKRGKYGDITVTHGIYHNPIPKVLN